MASVWKRDNSKYWIGCFTDARGRQLKRSTKSTDRDKALRITLDWERAADKAREGSLTETQCRKVLSEILESTTGEGIRSKETEAFFSEWLDSKEANKSAGTHLRYENTVNSFLGHIKSKAKRPIEAITAEDVQSWVNARRERGLAPKTVYVDAKTISGALERAVALGYLLSNPAKHLELAPVRTSKRSTFTTEQVGLLVGAAKEQDWKSVILLGFYTGARLSDCANLQRGNVDLTHGLITWTQQKTAGQVKDGDGSVTVPIHPALEKHLMAIAGDQPQAHVCPTLAGKKTGSAYGLSATFKKIMRDAGIDAGMVEGQGKRQFSKLSFHALRHSFNSALANADVSQELRMALTGHKTASINRQYTHHEIETLRTAIKNIPSI